MKVWLVLLLSAIVGILGGSGIAVWRVKSLPWDGTVEGAKGRLSPEETAKLDPRAAPPEGVPEVVVDHAEYDFGTMDSNTTGKHDFIFTNKGTGTLRLTKGQSTCRCTMTNFDQAEVPPGQSTKVNLEFKGKGFSGPYKQTATVITNDPRRSQIQLTVSGKIIPILRAVPEEIAFSSVAAGQPVTASVDVFDYVATPLKILGFECSDANTAGLFDMKVEPMKPEVLAKETGAKSGVQLLLTLKPGLPVGTFKQTIRLKTNLPGVEQYELEVRGNVVSDLAVVGGGWDEERSLLAIGTVSTKEEDVSRRLILIARGPSRDQVKLKVAEVSPSLLKVDLEPPTAVGQNLRRLPIVIRIPKGTPPADHLGSETAKAGRIVLETNHPQAQKVLIRVSFAVQN